MIATSRAAMISGSASRFRERQCSVQVLPGRCAALDGEPVGAGGHPEHQRIRRPRPGDTWLQKRKTRWQEKRDASA
jgi:hypothetical protein